MVLLVIFRGGGGEELHGGVVRGRGGGQGVARWQLVHGAAGLHQGVVGGGGGGGRSYWGRDRRRPPAASCVTRADFLLGGRSTRTAARKTGLQYFPDGFIRCVLSVF